jgi:ArsR family transcriptional regulator
VQATTAFDLTNAVRLFHALSDETRLAILQMLQDGERCVCDLQTDLDAAQSRLSFHLKVLREAGLVTDRKEGRWSYYAIVPESLAGTRSGAPEGANGAVASTVMVRACDRWLAVPPGVRNWAEMAWMPSASTVFAGIVLAV